MENKMEEINELIKKVEAIAHALKYPLNKKMKEDLRWYVLGLLQDIVNFRDNHTQEIEKDDEEETYRCVLCNEVYTGYGNNAQPLADGKCCDECNLLVIKERIKQMEDKK